MTTVTQEAEEFEPAGDPTHVGYGKNYGWECTCGRRSAHITTKDRAEYRGGQHEKYCEGTVTITLVSIV